MQRINNKSRIKLTLHKETLRALGSRELAHAAGGVKSDSAGAYDEGGCCTAECFSDVYAGPGGDPSFPAPQNCPAVFIVADRITESYVCK